MERTNGESMNGGEKTNRCVKFKFSESESSSESIDSSESTKSGARTKTSENDTNTNADYRDGEVSEGESKRPSSSETRPKPWSAGLCRLKLMPPSRCSKGRVSRMKEMRTTYDEVQYRSPYIDITWEKGGARCPALMDSGADWSLMSSEQVTDTARRGRNWENQGLRAKA